MFKKKIFFFLTKILYFPFTISISVSGYKLFVKKIDRFIAVLLWKINFLEKKEREFVKSVVNRDMITADIGANLGQYTVLLSHLVGKKGKVYSFEPNPEIYNLLKKSVEVNNLTNTHLSIKAISNKKGSGLLYNSPFNTGDNRLYKPNFMFNEVKIIETTLDDFLKKNQKIDFIKIDIQGGEFNALLGMSNIIKKNNNLIIMLEFCPKMLILNGITGEKFLNFLHSQFFNIYYFVDIKNNISILKKSNFKKFAKISGYKNIVVSRKNLI